MYGLERCMFTRKLFKQYLLGIHKNLSYQISHLTFLPLKFTPILHVKIAFDL